jgi:uncharacterized Zn ribbon protein
MDIKSYSQFLFESDTVKLVDVISTLTRNYNSSDTFYTDLTHFVVEKEYKKWNETRKNVELKKNTIQDASYELIFKLDERPYTLKCEYTFIFFGQHEKDEPDASFDMTSDRLTVVLDGIDIKHFSLKSSDINYDSNVSGQVSIAIKKFLIKVMINDYDMLSSKIYSLQQEK